MYMIYTHLTLPINDLKYYYMFNYSDSFKKCVNLSLNICKIYKICDIALCVLVTQSCLILCDLMECSQPGSSVHGILQARILEWLAIPFSRGSFWPRDWTCVSGLQADSLPSEPPRKPLIVWRKTKT